MDTAKNQHTYSNVKLFLTNKMINGNFVKPQRKRPQSQAINRAYTSNSNDRKTQTEQKSFDLHTWVDFEDQIRKMAIKSFHSSIEPKPKLLKKSIPNQKQQLQAQFKELIKDVLQMNLRNDLYNKLSKFI
ncbi:unnamed protein product (macronuclear) [Paramecium tetraurelia]|uniref:Uncharacterized protein n=1 Tax=Paramecium tetraurelia TaxID=5888 RepID=A0E3C2_PARTE|nr:uncharacterized protein GSPATT00022962001 [Paramecium tetraurelia]CAK89789.1 unnamed protein product [Paramecium tetraurelia]|eukprot:XP_001457186.1 hypothetical protein (macronuclear) [Paramecium tetraurelia strain d4-2]